MPTDSQKVRGHRCAHLFPVWPHIVDAALSIGSKAEAGPLPMRPVPFGLIHHVSDQSSDLSTEEMDCRQVPGFGVPQIPHRWTPQVTARGGVE